MKYKVVYKSKRKNSVRHIADKGSLEECERTASRINSNLYEVTIEDFKGNVIKQLTT